jgi:hypothetical protein
MQENNMNELATNDEIICGHSRESTASLWTILAATLNVRPLIKPAPLPLNPLYAESMFHCTKHYTHPGGSPFRQYIFRLLLVVQVSAYYPFQLRMSSASFRFPVFQTFQVRRMRSG